MTDMLFPHQKYVREYCEGQPVELFQEELVDDTGEPTGGKRWVVLAFNNSGHNCTKVDLLDLIAWLKKNKPELLGDI